MELGDLIYSRERDVNKKVIPIHYRSTGEIKGELSEVFPFIFLARYGSFNKERLQVVQNSKGRFIVNTVAGEGGSPRYGVILPISECKNNESIQALLKLKGFLEDNTGTKNIKVVRKKAQRLLDSTFKGALIIDEAASLNGFVEFKRTKGLFSSLRKDFVMVEDFIDEPGAVAHPNSYRDFEWDSYGQFLEWFYEGAESNDSSWDHCFPFLVFNNTCVLGDILFGWDDTVVPDMNVSNLFQIKDDAKDMPISIRFEMGEYGWAYMYLSIGNREVKTWLSNVFPPFNTMVEWIKRVERGEMPLQFEIDEEGDKARIAVFDTNEQNRVLLRIGHPYREDENTLEGIVRRQQLVGMFRHAIYNFFLNEFNSEHWDDEDLDTEGQKSAILNDPWFK